MTYYGINHYDQQYRRDFYKLYPDALGLFHRETDKRRREAVGKGWTYVQEREHAKNFESLGADWTYEHDGIFLLDFLRDPKAQSRPSSDSRGYSGSKSKAAPSCGTCGKLGRWFDTLETNLDELAVAAKRCTVCGLLAKGCRDAGALSEEVKVEVRMNSEGVVAFVLEVGLEAGGSRDIPIGIPPLRGEGSRFDLFRAWLRDCDEHGCASKDRWLPTRVLDLSDPDVIRLVDGQGDWSDDRLRALGLWQDLREYEYDHWIATFRTVLTTLGHFVALSHRWRSSDEHNFCTYKCNLAARQAGIRFSDLPKRFQDAVTVTRELGVQFLWIDSICIVQPHRDATADCPDGCGQDDDWRSECGKMSEYFGSAYCTLAATSADNPAVDEGILETVPLVAARTETPVSPDFPWRQWEPVEQQPGAFDDFAADVEGSELSKRGWVLQERALSCRTIFFTSKQAYWECGNGIRCESFTKLKNQTSQCLSDSHFPSVIGNKFDKNCVYLLYWLFEKFSSCGLSTPTDRSVAILGLEQRLGKILGSKWRYGIFQRYFHRCLIWQPCRGQRVKRIDPGVPSWSWMAYAGEITFMKIPFEKVSWNLDIQGLFESTEKEAPGVRLETRGRELEFNKTDEEWGRLIAGEGEREDAGRFLQFDRGNITERLEIESLRYVVLGRDDEWDDPNRDRCRSCYYVLVIKPLEGGSDKEYERVGLGSLKKRDLSLHVEQVYIV